MPSLREVNAGVIAGLIVLVGVGSWLLSGARSRPRNTHARRKKSVQTNATATTTTLFEGGGLRIEASCPGGVPTIDVRSLVDNSTIHLATIIDGDVAHYNEGDDFDSNVTRSLAVDGFTDNVQGTFTFHNGNGVNAPTVTATYLIEEATFQGNACAAFGNVEIL